MFKKIFYIGALTLCFSSVLTTKAQVQTNVAIWAGGGVSDWTSNIDVLKPKIGGGGIAGVGFEWWTQSFLFGLGGEYKYSTLNASITDFSFSRQAIDTENEGFISNHFYHSSDVKDNYRIHTLNVPLWIGLHNKSVYILGGVKAGLNLKSDATIKSYSENSATYDWAIDDFVNMPNHQITGRSLEKSSPIKFNTAIAAHAEVGFYLGGRKTGYYDKTSVRLAVFGDYTLNNYHRPVTEPLIFDQVMNMKLDENGVIHQYAYPALNPLLLSYESTTQIKLPDDPANIDLTKPLDITYLKMHPWFVGIKLTILFRLSSEPCHCDY
ncbi:MAG: hypothetical protein LBV75_02390 [Paludibacter sp.]|jgi:hypothetical protein|nr:hypothetical protein [Paludibacter sp.]